MEFCTAGARYVLGLSFPAARCGSLGFFRGRARFIEAVFYGVLARSHSVGFCFRSARSMLMGS
jgi:hypothetical protein